MPSVRETPVRKALDRVYIVSLILNNQKGMERIMLDMIRTDERRASWIREQTKCEDILFTIKRRKKVYMGSPRHVPNR